MLTDKLTINALIIDDEKEACDNLKTILSEFIDSDINIAGIANDTVAGRKLIETLRPDVVFLDIEMPDENAFQFLERISPFDFEIIFVTAYDEFAIKAFKLNAIDYILKPIDIDELAGAVRKMKDRIFYRLHKQHADHPADALRQIANKEHPHRLTLRSLSQLEVVDFRDIYSIEGQGSYSKISFKKAGTNREFISSNVLSYYEDILPASVFYRVHKSYLVNCSQIDKIILNGHFSLALNSKELIPISRRRYADFIKFLKENHFYSV